ncbi:unnamed protein product [Acanthoscelides obtectus]|uniref:Uncharacterized protein n=1 Tax=Acanthoscelides obtectus TaxID=200917 RepID=A0A9P0PTA9_ACAOB|nr:unnamed protein product [Acanthoscelides obtectus]CAK1628701.1 hypothetical protein AOBTE_LOCUS5350 [Acanthoscelides obtectus]
MLLYSASRIINDVEKKKTYGSTKSDKHMRNLSIEEALKFKKSGKSGGKPDDIYVPTVKWFRKMEEIMDSYTAENETKSIVSQKCIFVITGN